MPGRWHFLRSPRWIGLHLLTVALVVAMVLLGHWQLDVSNRKHFSVQNFGYALQWWGFSLFTLWMWFRLVRDHGVVRDHGGAVTADAVPATPRTDEPVAYRRYVMPQSGDAPTTPVDDVHAAYNEYLARLADADTDAGADPERTS